MNSDLVDRPAAQGWARLLCALLLLSQAAVAISLLVATRGQALYLDDHPSFMYRFSMFARTFPYPVVYDPWWNAGTKHGAVVSSGLVPLGVLFLPLWRFFPILEVYTPFLASLFFGVLPWVVVGSLRLVGSGWAGAFAAGVLALGVSRQYLVHLIAYGTVGSLFATFFCVPLCAALYRLLWLDRRDLPTAAALIVSAALFFSWPGSVFPGFLIAVALLPAWRRIFTRPNLLFLGACAAVVLLLLAPQTIALLRHSRIAGMVQADAPPTVTAALLPTVWRGLRDQLLQGNPLLTVLGFLGVFFLGRGWRTFLGPLLAGLLLLSATGESWKPTLQLGRLAMPFFLLACLPAGLWCDRIFGAGRRKRAVAAGTALLVLLAVSALHTARQVGALASGGTTTLSAPMRDFIAWIRANTPPDARLLFAGNTIHGYGAGHVAFLPVLAEREMMAGDFYAFSPKLDAAELPPASWQREGREGILAYFDLFRVTHVVTFHERWKKFMRRNPEVFEEAASFPQRTLTITVFRVRKPPPRLLAGEGEVQARHGRLRVQLARPEEAVLRYRWVEGLKVDGGVVLSPEPVAKDVVFIRARPGRNTTFTIHYP